MRLVVLVVLEEGFVRADHLGVLLQALPHAGAQADDALDAVGRQEGVAEDRLGLLADAVDAAGPLDQADDGPGQVVVDDDRASCRFWPSLSTSVAIRTRVPGRATTCVRLLLLTGLKRQASCVGSSVSPVTPPARLTPRACSCVGKVVHGVGELGEDEHLLAPDALE